MLFLGNILLLLLFPNNMVAALLVIVISLIMQFALMLIIKAPWADCVVFFDYNSDWAGDANRLYWRGCVIKRNVENGSYDQICLNARLKMAKRMLILG